MALATIRGDDPIPAKAGIGLRFQHHEAVLEPQPDPGFGRDRIVTADCC